MNWSGWLFLFFEVVFSVSMKIVSLAELLISFSFSIRVLSYSLFPQKNHGIPVSASDVDQSISDVQSITSISRDRLLRRLQGRGGVGRCRRASALHANMLSHCVATSKYSVSDARVLNIEHADHVLVRVDWGFRVLLLWSVHNSGTNEILHQITTAGACLSAWEIDSAFLF